MIGPGFTDVDLSLAKEFPIHWESVRLGIRADAYNAFNHVNYQNPNANVGYYCSNYSGPCGAGTGGSLADPTAGTITGPAGYNASMRIIQLGARLTF